MEKDSGPTMEDGRVVITFAEVLQMDCWLLLKVTLRKLLRATNTTISYKLLFLIFLC